MFSFRRKPDPGPDPLPDLLRDLAQQVRTARQEAEHACETTRALADAVERLATRAARIDGRLERLELYLLAVDPDYPVTQAEAPDLDAARVRLEAALNGAHDG